MGKTIRVTPEELQKVSGQMADLSKEYIRLYGLLYQEVDGMAAAWSGEDNIAFVDQIKGFTQKLTEMATKLQTASDALMKQKTNYSNRQDTNITQVRKLQN